MVDDDRARGLFLQEFAGHVTGVLLGTSRAGGMAPMKGTAANTSTPRRPTFKMQSLDIQGFTYEERHGLLPVLTTAMGNCGGWVLERKTLSPTNMEFRLEIQLGAILDLYASIIATGVELTRSGHEALTEQCTRCKHLRMRAELGQVVAIRLEISFLDDLTLHSLLASGGRTA
jgi:hypothetical protein